MSAAAADRELTVSCDITVVILPLVYEHAGFLIGLAISEFFLVVEKVIFYVISMKLVLCTFIYSRCVHVYMYHSVHPYQRKTLGCQFSFYCKSVRD